METMIKSALTESVKQYGSIIKEDAQPILERLYETFDSHEPFLDKVNLMDQVFDDFPKFDELREYTFDLILSNFFTDDVKRLDEEFMESPEWEKIEEETLDRGTEMLNTLLYLSECKDEQIDPEIEDFLNEFLLVQEDEFQDEHRIYEPMIANQILVESSYEEIGKVATKLDSQAEIKEIFYSLVSYFYVPEPENEDFEDFLQYAPNPALDSALYKLLINFK